MDADGPEAEATTDMPTSSGAPITHRPTSAVSVEPPVEPATGVDSEEELHFNSFRTENGLHRHLRGEKHQVIGDHDRLPAVLTEKESDNDDNAVHNLERSKGNRALQAR